MTILSTAANEHPLTREEIIRKFGLVSLDVLTDDHMTPEQARHFNSLLANVREWRRQWEPGASFVLLSPNVGIGKSTIAQAVADSFSEVRWGYGDEPSEVVDPFGRVVASVALERFATTLTARQLMEMIQESKGWRERFDNLRIVVLDDVGREGLLEFVKQDATQDIERQARYFEFFNYCYTRVPRLSFFMTSNLVSEQLKVFFNDATWDRINEMARRPWIWESYHIPSYRQQLSGRTPQK